MTRKRVNFTLSDTTREILADQDNASLYVDQLVQQTERRWRDAHRLIRDAGWYPAEIEAALDALNGYFHHAAPSTYIAVELLDANELSGVASRRGVEADRWAALTRQVAESAELADAVITLAAEFWRLNPRVERLVSGS